MLNRFIDKFRDSRAIKRVVGPFALAMTFILLTGCASRTIDKSFDQLISSLDQITLAVAPPDRPKNCGGGPREPLVLYVRFNGACPKEVVPKENGCENGKSRNVVCVCRNKIGSESITWQAAEYDSTGGITEIAESYELYFNPFLPDPAFAATAGKIEAGTLVDEPPVLSFDDLIAFKYTIYKDGCDPVDPRIIIDQ